MFLDGGRKSENQGGTQFSSSIAVYFTITLTTRALKPNREKKARK